MHLQNALGGPWRHRLLSAPAALVFIALLGGAGCSGRAATTERARVSPDGGALAPPPPPPGVDGGIVLPPSDAADGPGATPEPTDGATATCPPPPPPPGTAAVLTFRNDNQRTGGALLEQQLDVARVRAHGMKLAFTNPVDSDIYAQPLYVPGLMVNGKIRDVVFIATMANKVYAFDANEPAADPPGSSTMLWTIELRDPEDPGARPLPRGIYSTPVIDAAAGIMYLVHSTRNTSHDTGQLPPEFLAGLKVEFFLVALDLHDGHVLRTRRIAGSYPRNDGTPVDFDPRNHWCRPALLLGHGSIFLACGMRDAEASTLYHGWVFRYDAATFAPQATFCTTPDVTVQGQGASVWQSGSGLAEDDEGNVYFITANGPADFKSRLYGDALVKLSTKGGTLAVASAFTPETPDAKLQENDVDFGSGGALVLPDAHFVLGAGKTGIAYLLDRNSLDKVQEFQAAVNQYNPTAPVDSAWEGGPHIHGTSAYWPGAGQSYLYTWGEQDYLRRQTLELATGRFNQMKALQGKVLGLERTMPGGMLSLSANGRQAGTGILWASIPRYPDPEHNPGGRLLAFDAETLDLLWETTLPSLPRWMPPTIADGKVFVGTTSNRFLIFVLGP